MTGRIVARHCGVRARGGIAVVVTHRPSTLNSVDQVALVMDKTIKLFGPKEKVLRELGQKPVAAVSSLIHVVEAGRGE